MSANAQTRQTSWSGLIVSAANIESCTLHIVVLPSHQGTGSGKQLVSTLVSLSAKTKKIVLYSVPSKKPFSTKFGFQRKRTAMAIFENHVFALGRRYIDESKAFIDWPALCKSALADHVTHPPTEQCSP